MAKQDDFARYTIRIPASLYAKIEAAAEAAERSINAEIMQRLELAMSENIWERQKFIDTLNFKQHIIDKQIHILNEALSEKNKYKDLLNSERAIRDLQATMLRLVCLTAYQHSSSPPELKQIAAETLRQLPPLNNEADHDYDLDRALGDRDDIDENWEDSLSEEDRKRLAESRQWRKDYE